MHRPVTSCAPQSLATAWVQVIVHMLGLTRHRPEAQSLLNSHISPNSLLPVQVLPLPS